MSSRNTGWIATAFVIGLAIPTLVIWNPAKWEWADALTGRNASTVSSTSPNMNTAMNAGPQAGGKSERKIAYWRAPMDPTYIRDEPGKSPM